MIPYNQIFKEGYEKIAELTPQSISAETNLAARVDISEYTRIVVIIQTAGTQTIAVDLEQADALSGGTIKDIDAALNFTVPAVAGSYIQEVRSEQFDTNPGIPSVESFRWFNVELTPAGANVTNMIVFGLPKNNPPTDNWGTNA